MLTLALPSVLRMRDAGLPVGRLFQPRHVNAVAATQAAGLAWAADNDAFSGFDRERFERMLDVLQGHDGCRFVACPDVVGDAAATLALFEEWEPELHRRGFPVGLVLQDGQEDRAVPWGRVEAVFVGGTTEWKMSPLAGRLALEGRTRGKWVHVGRVNSARRILYARAIGADSIDGSKWVRWQDTFLPQLQRAMGDGQTGIGGI